MPENVKSELEIIPIRMVDEALKYALTGPLTPIDWKEEDEAPIIVPAAVSDPNEGGLAITH